MSESRGGAITGRLTRLIPAGVAALAMLAAAPSFAQTAPTAPPAAGTQLKWGPFIDFEGKPGTQRSIGEADVFVPVWQDSKNMLFADLRTRLDDQNSYEGNFGGGGRTMLDSGWNLGAYGYFDRRHTPNDNFFTQATFGAEALSLDWDLRGNMYLPQGDRTKNANGLNSAAIYGTSVMFRGGEEKSMQGFDGEAGWRVPLFDADAMQQLRVYGGGYSFYADGVKPIMGPRARLDLTFEEVPTLWAGSRLTLGIEVQNDTPRGTQAFGVVRLRIPLQIFGEKMARLTPMERRMTDTIVRDVDIVSQAGAFGAPQAVTQTASGQAITVLSSASTTGAGLPNAVTNAGANSAVILSGSFSTTATTTLQSGQALIGGGNLVVRAPDGRTAVVAVPGATITGTVGGNAPTLDLANNSSVSGLAVSNTGGGATNPIAIRANGVSGVTITNNTATASETGANTAEALLITGGSTGVVAQGNTLTASSTGGVAIGVNVVNSTATVARNTLSASGNGGGNNSRAASTNGATLISAASTGNVKSAGTCDTGSTATGFLTFTDGTTCP